MCYIVFISLFVTFPFLCCSVINTFSSLLTMNPITSSNIQRCSYIMHPTHQNFTPSLSFYYSLTLFPCLVFTPFLLFLRGFVPPAFRVAGVYHPLPRRRLHQAAPGPALCSPSARPSLAPATSINLGNGGGIFWRIGSLFVCVSTFCFIQ